MSAPDDAGAGSLLDHLVELRSRLLRGIVGVVVALLALLPFTSQLYTWLALPLVSRLPAGQQMIALNPAGAFFAPIKLAFFVAVFAAAPWLLYQAWAFIAPRSEEHTSELQSLMRISYAVFCLKKKNN